MGANRMPNADIVAIVSVCCPAGSCPGLFVSAAAVSSRLRASFVRCSRRRLGTAPAVAAVVAGGVDQLTSLARRAYLTSTTGPLLVVVRSRSVSPAEKRGGGGAAAPVVVVMQQEESAAVRETDYLLLVVVGVDVDRRDDDKEKSVLRSSWVASSFVRRC